MEDNDENHMIMNPFKTPEKESEEHEEYEKFDIRKKPVKKNMEEEEDRKEIINYGEADGNEEISHGDVEAHGNEGIASAEDEEEFEERYEHEIDQSVADFVDEVYIGRNTIR
ncbi:hypothetical protein Bca4012_080116 [Brassica carinata]|uniref:Uncharacterized protein n=1 Tax=Brassica carinata TaxID=52824 RepID=A0A8X7NUY4_BRACI|nr:hypothetical protein Bca52824_092256 [Brassica carinata]